MNPNQTLWPLYAIISCLALTGCFGRHSEPKVIISKGEPKFESATVDHWLLTDIKKHPRYGREITKRSSLASHLEATLKHLSQRKSLPSSLTKPAPNRQELMDGLSQLRDLANQPLSLFWKGLDENFLLLTPVSQENDPAFFTGYYTPIYRGSRRPTKNFPYPVYAPPSDLKSNPQQYTREAIDRRGLLFGKELDICYLSSPLEVLLLQVQGSGTVHLEDGTSLGLGFAGHNGQAYTSLGKVLIDEKLITAEEVSLGAIKKAYRKDPVLVSDLILRNQRYIFFRESDGQPRGSSGAVVKAFHSIATERFSDRSYRFPVHIPAWLSLSLPHEGQRDLLALCQDTGSAIRGDLRVDIYLDHGASAERVAGDLKNRGQLSLLWHRHWPKPTAIGSAPVNLHQ